MNKIARYLTHLLVVEAILFVSLFLVEIISSFTSGESRQGLAQVAFAISWGIAAPAHLLIPYYILRTEKLK